MIGMELVHANTECRNFNGFVDTLLKRGMAQLYVGAYGVKINGKVRYRLHYEALAKDGGKVIYNQIRGCNVLYESCDEPALEHIESAEEQQQLVEYIVKVFEETGKRYRPKSGIPPGCK